MAGRNRKKGYYNTGFLLKSIDPIKIEGELSLPEYSKTPLAFRYKHHNGQGLTKEDRVFMENWLTQDTAIVIETKYPLDYDNDDLVAFSLETNENEDEQGVPYENYGRIQKVSRIIDTNESASRYRKKNVSIDTKYVLFVS